jgi:hypothetical protein
MTERPEFGGAIRRRADAHVYLVHPDTWEQWFQEYAAGALTPQVEVLGDDGLVVLRVDSEQAPTWLLELLEEVRTGVPSNTTASAWSRARLDGSDTEFWRLSAQFARSGQLAPREVRVLIDEAALGDEADAVADLLLRSRVAIGISDALSEDGDGFIALLIEGVNATVFLEDPSPFQVTRVGPAPQDEQDGAPDAP